MGFSTKKKRTRENYDYVKTQDSSQRILLDLEFIKLVVFSSFPSHQLTRKDYIMNIKIFDKYYIFLQKINFSYLYKFNLSLTADVNGSFGYI